MRPQFSLAFALCCAVLCQAPAWGQTKQQPAVQPASPATPLASPAAPQAVSPITDPATYVALQFGPSFKVDAKLGPLVGDLDGDGDEDLVLFATSPTPLLSQEQFQFKVEDPYDAYFGEGDPHITSQFNVHFDGSGRQILIVFGWRLPPPAHKPKHAAKFVLINTPMETASLANLRLKKKDVQAIEAVDRTSLHSLVFWDGRRWRWSAQGMDGDDPLKPDRN